MQVLPDTILALWHLFEGVHQNTFQRDMTPFLDSLFFAPIFSRWGKTQSQKQTHTGVC